MYWKVIQLIKNRAYNCTCPHTHTFINTFMLLISFISIIFMINITKNSRIKLGYQVLVTQIKLKIFSWVYQMTKSSHIGPISLSVGKSKSRTPGRQKEGTGPEGKRLRQVPLVWLRQQRMLGGRHGKGHLLKVRTEGNSCRFHVFSQWLIK